MLKIPGFETAQIEDFRKEFGRVKARENKDRNLRHENTLAAAVASGKVTSRANETPMKNAISAWVGHMRSLLPDYIIRRTIQSKGPDGRPISNLTPYHEKVVFCTLREDEMEVQRALASHLVEENVQSQKELTVSQSHALRLFVRRVRTAAAVAAPHRRPHGAHSALCVGCAPRVARGGRPSLAAHCLDVRTHMVSVAHVLRACAGYAQTPH